MRNKIRFYNRLFFRIYLCIGGVLSIFSIVVGVVFINLYKQSNMDVYTSQLKLKAINVASKVTEYAAAGQYDEYLNYMDAIESMEDSSITDIWIMRNRNAENPLRKKYENVSLKKSDLTTDTKKVINKAFKNTPPWYLSLVQKSQSHSLLHVLRHRSWVL